jgi:hypothetical protein
MKDIGGYNKRQEILIGNPNAFVRSVYVEEKYQNKIYRTMFKGYEYNSLTAVFTALQASCRLTPGCHGGGPSLQDSNKVSNIIRRHTDNRKLLLICILLLADSFIFFRFNFYQYMVVFLFNTVIYVFLLLGLIILIVQLPWLRFYRAFSLVVRQMPGCNSQRGARPVLFQLHFCVVLCIVFCVVLCIVCLFFVVLYIVRVYMCTVLLLYCLCVNVYCTAAVLFVCKCVLYCCCTVCV